MKSISETNNATVHHRAWISIVPQLFGAVLAGCLLVHAFGNAQKTLSEFVFVPASFDGAPILGRDYDVAEEMIAAWQRRGEKPVGLHFGNSQIAAPLRPEFQAGQTNAAEKLFKHFQPQGLEVLTLALPLGTFMEFYIAAEYLLPRLNPTFLLLPVMPVTMRPNEVRDSVIRFMHDPQTAAALEQTEIGTHLLARFDNAHQMADNTESGALHETMQEQTEKAINDMLDKHWKLWALRPEARERIGNELALMRLRLINGIGGQTKRHIIKGGFYSNMAALAALLESAQKKGVRVLLYVSPFRHDVEFPYFEDEYTTCLSQIEQLAEKHRAAYADLENAVPSDYFGETDRWHFSDKGARILAERLAELIEKEGLKQ